MGSLTALLLATPVFGLALSPPTGVTPPTQLLVGLSPAQVASASGAGALEEEPGEDGGDTDMAELARSLRERQGVIGIHRALGIATWASMTMTVVLGTIQYHNLYGLFAAREDTPCDTGGATFGQDQCSGTPWPHLISSIATTGLYTATFVASLLMPDPFGADEGDSDYARKLRTHKLLRWVHFGGMVAQIALGILAANGQRFGLDRANDYGTLQALSTIHMGIGLVTWGALTWAGAQMVL